MSVAARVRARARLAVLLVGAVVLGGCSAERAGSPTSPAQEDTPQPRCFAAMPGEARTEELTVASGAGDVAAIGFPADGATTAMVLLHQTGGLGACGWGRFATAAQQAGISSIAVDLCGYGLSRCDEEADQSAVVEAAVERARTWLGADRVVLVGSSMGGHRAVAAVAAGVAVDAWVDVSGPDAWDDGRLSDLRWARSQAGRSLIVFGADEPPHELAAARRLAARTGARLVVRPEGHGYELLTSWTGRLLPAGRELLRFVDPSAAGP